MSTTTERQHLTSQSTHHGPCDLVAIDMIDPTVTCTLLQVSQTHLIDLVNRGDLAAYQFGHNIRFRRVEVESVRDQSLVAA